MAAGLFVTPQALTSTPITTTWHSWKRDWGRWGATLPTGCSEWLHHYGMRWLGLLQDHLDQAFAQYILNGIQRGSMSASGTCKPAHSYVRSTLDNAQVVMQCLGEEGHLRGAWAD